MVLAAVIATTLLGTLAPPPPPAHAGTCSNLQVTRLPAGTKVPGGGTLSDPISEWEQISAQCMTGVAGVKVHVPDCAPACQPPGTHRFISEYWSHSPTGSDCTLSNEPNFADTITCPGKGTRVCVYLKKSPGPDVATAITSEDVTITFNDASPPVVASPALGPAVHGCGIGDHPTATTPPTAERSVNGGQLLCHGGTWAGEPPVTLAYEWYDGIIQVGTGSVYVIKPEDVGHSYYCRVTATNGEGITTTTGTSAVFIAPPPDNGGTGGGTTSGGSTGTGTATTTGLPTSVAPCVRVTVRKTAEIHVRPTPSPFDAHTAPVQNGGAVGRGSDVTWRVSVFGPQGCPLRDVVVTDVVSPGFTGRPPIPPLTGLLGPAVGGGMQWVVRFAAGSDQRGDFVFHGTADRLGEITNVATARVQGVEYRSNVARITVVPMPQIKQARADASGASGTAADGGDASAGGGRAAQARPRTPALRRVDVAIRRVQRGRCLWLRGRTATFTRVPGRCGPPRAWLRASGTTRWAYRPKRRLPKGRYELYVRAVNAVGVSDGTFRAARGNLVRFRLP